MAAAATAIIASPAQAGYISVVPVAASWSSAPADCASPGSVDLSGYAGAGANPGVPLNAGSSQLFAGLSLVPANCDGGAVSGWLELYAAGPARVQGPSHCPSGAVSGTYERIGELVVLDLVAEISSETCPLGDDRPADYSVPVSGQLVLSPGAPAGAGVVEYGVGG